MACFQRALARRALGCLILGAALGAPLRPADVPRPVAEQVALGWLRQAGHAATDLRVDAVLPLGEASGPLLYAVNVKPEGWVLVAAEDAASPVVGFSLTGAFGAGELPPALDAYLSGRKREVVAIRLAGLEAGALGRTQWARAAACAGAAISAPGAGQARLSFTGRVPPEATPPFGISVWDQDQYYNANCPVDRAGPGGHVLTGCLATAMGQVMRQFSFPATGTGSASYKHPTYGVLSADFGRTSYAWKDMPSSLSGPNSAVALLLSQCGISIGMGYGTTISSGSVPMVPQALVDYFGYSGSIMLLRPFGDPDAWSLLMKQDLCNQRPVIYGAQDLSTGSHAWLLEGYKDMEGTTFFTCNWGWKGSGNGYYSLSNLNPSGHSFTEDPFAVVGIIPSDRMPVPVLHGVILDKVELPLGQSVAVAVEAANAGAPASDGLLCVSFPGLTDPADTYLISDVQVPDGLTCWILPAGSLLQGRQGPSLPSTALQVVLASENGWTGTPRLAFKVRPKRTGAFRILARATLGQAGAYISDPRDASYIPGGLSAAPASLDQQGWEAMEADVQVIDGHPCFPLTVLAVPGAGQVEVGLSQNCDGGYTPGTAIPVSAVAPPGLRFDSWTGTGGTFADPNAQATTFTLTGTAQVVAHFVDAALPTIAWFKADKQTFQAGSQATLSWSVNGATGLVLDPGGFAVQDVPRLTVRPQGADDTVWTLTASNAAGILTRTVVLLYRSEDLNGDGAADVLDLATLLKAFGSRPGDLSWNVAADLNGDGVVDDADLQVLLAKVQP